MKDYNTENKGSQYYGNEYFDYKRRLETFKNNYNYFLNDNELEELVKKKCTFGKKRNLSFRQYIKAYYEDFELQIKEEIKKMTSLNEKSDALYLWANYGRVLDKTIGLENVIEDEGVYLENKRTEYNIDSITETKEALDILNNEYMLFDLETTGFKKLNQIIEFGGIIYNRQVSKTDERLKEILRETFPKNTILYLFKFFKFNYLQEVAYDLLLDYSQKNIELKKENISGNVFKEKKNLLDKELLEKINDEFLIITKEELLAKLEELEIFKFMYNKKIHFYFELYKDYVTKTTYEIHHLSNELIIQKGIKIDKILDGLYKVLNNQVLLAHNIGFDITKIAEFFNDFKYKGPKIKKIVDTISLFQILNKEIKIGNKVFSYSLDSLSKLYLGINLKAESDSTQDRHTAIFDVKLTNENLIKIKGITENIIELNEVIKEKKDEMFNYINNFQSDQLSIVSNIDKEKYMIIEDFIDKKIIKVIQTLNVNEFIYNKIHFLFNDYLTLIKDLNIEDKNVIDKIEKYIETEKGNIIKSIEEYMGKEIEKKNILNSLLKNIGKDEKQSKKKKGVKNAENNLSLF